MRIMRSVFEVQGMGKWTNLELCLVGAVVFSVDDKGTLILICPRIWHERSSWERD